MNLRTALTTFALMLAGTTAAFGDDIRDVDFHVRHVAAGGDPIFIVCDSGRGEGDNVQSLPMADGSGIRRGMLVAPSTDPTLRRAARVGDEPSISVYTVRGGMLTFVYKSPPMPTVTVGKGPLGIPISDITRHFHHNWTGTTLQRVKD